MERYHRIPAKPRLSRLLQRLLALSSRFPLFSCCSVPAAAGSAQLRNRRRHETIKHSFLQYSRGWFISRSRAQHGSAIISRSPFRSSFDLPGFLRIRAAAFIQGSISRALRTGGISVHHVSTAILLGVTGACDAVIPGYSLRNSALCFPPLFRTGEYLMIFRSKQFCIFMVVMFGVAFAASIASGNGRNAMVAAMAELFFLFGWNEYRGGEEAMSARRILTIFFQSILIAELVLAAYPDHSYLKDPRLANFLIFAGIVSALFMYCYAGGVEVDRLLKARKAESE